MFDGLYSKKIIFSYYMCHQTVDLMTELWNTCTYLFLPKLAQAEKNECLTAADQVI